MRMKGSLRVRDATASDAAAIAAIHNASIRAGDSTMDESLKEPRDVRQLLETRADGEALLVLEEAGRVVGWGIVRRYSARAGYRFAGETSVFLCRDCTGRGLGRRLQAALMDRCRQLGYHHLVAKVFANNIASIKMHAQLGYELVGVQREIGFKQGRWQDVAILQCVLGEDMPER
jgi:L-amino acid N-acyltransferase YncA